MHFLSTIEAESLIADFLKLINENKDVQDKIYTCDKPATKYDVTIRFIGGVLSAWLNDNDNPASLLAEFDTKELILTIYAGERTYSLRKVIFSQSIRECLAQAILRKYGYRVYFARRYYKSTKLMYCHCNILNGKGDFTIKKFRIYPSDPLYFRFDLKNLSVENFDKNV